MSTPDSQLFRTRSSSRIVPIPTRHDPKTGQRVIRWKDIQLYFVDAQCVKHGEEVLLFLTDGDLEDLVPLRIAHHPGVVLEVVSLDDIQGESTPVAASSPIPIHGPGSTSTNGSHVDDDQFAFAITPSNTTSIAKDVNTLKITETEDNQDFVMRHQGFHPETSVQELPLLGADYIQSWKRSVDQQEQLRKLQERIAKVHLTIQQEQNRLSQWQIKDQDKTALDDLKQINQRTMLYSQHQLQQHSSPEKQYQEAIDRLAMVQYRVQATLSTSYKELSIPRLFIILPRQCEIVDGQGPQYPMQFRL
ncbi:hypothetical protein B0O80DRAFT_500590 [Mortierella sp. GBAus27b]|nr:hypothetical protein BGX31_001910 [Mortierella sp. GBA43]KAI8350809.1 hypothetical protein B0O80DRAFT_500590 [Mortierella sp. GBAus27b]